MPLPGWRLPPCSRPSRSRKRRPRTTDQRHHRRACGRVAIPRRSRATGALRRLVGLNVYNDSNESLGSINDLLTDKSGNIKAVVIGVGGFLGVGEHLVAVPLDKIKFVNEPVAYTGASSAPADTAGAGLHRPRRRPALRRRRRRGRSPIRGIRITPCSARPRIS